jgi:hypothetical protein
MSSERDIKATSAPPSVSLPQKLMVGASAGIFGQSLIYPIDVLKTKMQSAPQRVTIGSVPALFSSIAKSGGLYRGFSACLIGIAPEKALKLTINDWTRDYFTGSGLKPIQVYQEVISGSLAGFFQLAITVPYECVKIKMQMGEVATAGEAVKKLGAEGLYRGFTATFFRDVPFCFMFFPLYAKLKSIQMDYLTAYHNKTNDNLMINSNLVTVLEIQPVKEPPVVGLLAGIGAGAVSAAIVTPADMLKTNIQRGMNGDMRFFEYAKDIFKRRGMAMLFSGWQARVAVIAPLYGIVSLAFEVQKKILGL